METVTKYGVGKWLLEPLLEFENAILDLFEKNRITIQDAKTVLWTLLTDIYEDELCRSIPANMNILSSNLDLDTLFTYG